MTIVLKVGSVNAGIPKFGSTMTDWGISSLPAKPKPLGRSNPIKCWARGSLNSPGAPPRSMAFRYLSPALAPGTVPAQSVSAGSVWPASLASGTGVLPLILTAIASTKGPQTRNVVVPALGGVAPNGSAALDQGIETSKTEAISHRGSDFDRSPASSFPGCNRGNHIDTSPSVWLWATLGPREGGHLVSHPASVADRPIPEAGCGGDKGRAEHLSHFWFSLVQSRLDRRPGRDGQALRHGPRAALPPRRGRRCTGLACRAAGAGGRARPPIVTNSGPGP